MIRDRRFLLVFLTIALFLPVQAQSYNNQQIILAEQLHSVAENAPPELAYIQTSKDIYETGEDLWFKVYLLHAQYLTPSNLSRTLYLQMLSEKDKKVVWQEKYEIQNGFATGHVFIESTLAEGDYYLEAYAPNSFFNDTSSFKAVRRIGVITDINKRDTTESSTMPAHDNGKQLQFTTFPEGGDLVSGINSKLAFKAVNSNGEPVDVEGILFMNNSPLLEFKSTYAGMGSFWFTPDIDKKYIIRLSKPSIDSLFLLPEIYASGMTIQLVERDKESLSFKVSQSALLNQEDIYLRVQCRGVVYGMAMGKLSGEVRIKMPLSGLPQGIAEVTLFNSNLVPVAERLVYINHEKKLNIAAELSKGIYPTRGKATVKIAAKDEQGKPVVANLGITVFDQLYQNSHDSNNILSHYYLSTQLKGRIYNPSYYFNSISKDRDEALDLLMLTQGWRKYEWNEMNLEKMGKVPQKIIFDEIRGQVIIKTVSEKMRYERKFIMTYSPNKDTEKELIQADSAGRFTVSPDKLKKWENDYIYMKPFWSHKYPPPIELTDPFETINLVMRAKEISYPLQRLNTSTEETPDLISVHDLIIIPEVTIRGQKRYAIHGKYLGALDSLAKFEMNKDYVCQYGYLNCPFHSPDEVGSRKPKVGEWVKKLYYPTGLHPIVLDLVYVLPRYTEDQLLRMNYLTRVKAYYGNRKFYQPDYDKETDESVIPDLRNTLLWEPSVITDEKGEATLSFYCSDINTDFVGRIEGVSSEGLLGSGNFKLTVRNLNITP